MKIKTCELNGAMLDYAVAIITNPEWTPEDIWYNTVGYEDTGDIEDVPYEPSCDWARCGPIIEQEKIVLINPTFTNYFDTESPWLAWMTGDIFGYGPTPLVAAMRCFVLSKLGEEVEIDIESLLTI